MEPKAQSEHFSMQPRSDALQAAGLDRDNVRFRAKAAGLERAALQAGGFCANSAVVALQAGGLERDAARTRDSELRHSRCFFRTPTIKPPTLLYVGAGWLVRSGW